MCIRIFNSTNTLACYSVRQVKRGAFKAPLAHHQMFHMKKLLKF